MNKTKIVCTMGPSCSDIDTIKSMINAGMNVARFNMSHGNHETHKKLIDLVKQAREELNKPVALMIDTKGPEIRIKQFENGKIILKNGQKFCLTTKDIVGNETSVSVTYQKLPKIVKKGTIILLNDGLIELEVSNVLENLVETIVLVGGELSNNKSINIPSVELQMDYLSETDKKDIAFGIQEGVDAFSISFVNSANDVNDVKNYLKSIGEDNPFIISKIESAKGVQNMNEIISASDGVMVARGDMGVEVAFEKLPYIQKQIIKKASELGKLSITATQMLESMVVNTRPTRAEISDIANAIYDGTSAIMLSGETSAGKHPVLTVETMRKIASQTEETINYEHSLETFSALDDITAGIGYAACALASSLSAKAILVTTNYGTSAKSICRFRPKTGIIALSPNKKIYYRLAMFWGITPILNKKCSNTDELLQSAKNKALEYGLISSGDTIVQTSGLVENETGSNMLVVSQIN